MLACWDGGGDYAVEAFAFDVAPDEALVDLLEQTGEFHPVAAEEQGRALGVSTRVVWT